MKKLFYYNLTLFSLTLALWWLAKNQKDWLEYWYVGQFYPLVSDQLTRLSAMVPIDLASTLEIALYSSIGLVFILSLNPLFKRPFFTLAKALLRALAVALTTAFLYLALFGATLHRASPSQLFQVPDEIDDQARQRVFNHIADQTQALALVFERDEQNCAILPHSPLDYHPHILTQQNQLLEAAQMPLRHHGYIKYFSYSSFYHRLGIGGEYWPLTAEMRINALTHPLMQPFVMAHERAHLAGFGHETSADLFAYLTLIRSSSKELNYLGYLMVVNDLYKRNDYRPYLNGVHSNIYADLNCIYHYQQTLPKRYEFLSRQFWRIYERGHIINGVSEGLKSYHQADKLLLKWLAVHLGK